MKPTIVPASLRYGICEKKPLRNFPEGEISIQMGNREFVTASVKSEGGIRRFYVKEVEGYWEPFAELPDYNQSIKGNG